MTPDPSTRAATDRARKVLDAYGADPARWPATERAAIAAAIAADPALTAAQADARRLDGALARMPAPEIPAINPLAITAAARRGAPRGVRIWIARAAGLAAAAVLGFAVGLTGPLRTPMTGENADALAVIATIDEEML